MAIEQIINLGENITFTIREENSLHYFDKHWFCPLNAFIIFTASAVILTAVLADSLSSSTKKQSHQNVTTIIRFLALASCSECLLGRSLSIVFALVYVYEPPHYILCRLSSASTIFAVILESLCIGCIAVPKLYKVSLRLWLILIMALAFTLPVLVMSAHIKVRYFISRNACGVVGDSNVYYILAVLMLAFIPSWIAMIYYLIMYKCKVCPESYTGMDDGGYKDGRFLGLLILLYIVFVIPNIISVLLNGLISNEGNRPINGTKFDVLITWMVCLFWYFWPSLTLFMYPSLSAACKSLLLDCRNVRSMGTLSRSKNIYCDNLTPVLMATSDGLLLHDLQGAKQIDLTLISDSSSKSSKQTTQTISIKPEADPRQNKKMVRFACHVKYIPEASNVYNSLPTYYGSSSSSSSTK